MVSFLFLCRCCFVFVPTHPPTQMYWTGCIWPNVIYTVHRERLLMWSSISCINHCHNSRRLRLTTDTRACVRACMRALALMRRLPASFQRMSEHYLSSSQALTLHSQRSNWPSLYLFHKGEKHKKSFTIKKRSFCFAALVHFAWWMHPNAVKPISKRQEATSGWCSTRLWLRFSFIFKAETKKKKKWDAPGIAGIYRATCGFLTICPGRMRNAALWSSNSCVLMAFLSTDVLKWKYAVQNTHKI